jgi:hypothetical protein
VLFCGRYDGWMAAVLVLGLGALERIVGDIRVGGIRLAFNSDVVLDTVMGDSLSSTESEEVVGVRTSVEE